MVDPTTTNTSLAIPIRGSDVGTWDVPMNGNFNILDSMFGTVTTVALSTTSVTLTTSQAQASVIRFTGTLLTSLRITLPDIRKFWIIDNQITNSPSSFAIQISNPTVTSLLGAPPGVQDIFFDGTTVNYRNLGKLGEYWYYSGTTVPTWVGLSTFPPYINCAGGVFSSAAYPQLANLLGTTTLPDMRGTAWYSLNQGSGRLSAAVGGLDGNTLFATKFTESVTITTPNLPPYTPSGNIGNTNVTSVTFPVRTYSATAGFNDATHVSLGNNAGADAGSFTCTGPTITSTFGGIAQGGTSTPMSNIGTGVVGGIVMIKAT